MLSSNWPRFSAPGRCSLSCPSAARPWLAVQRRRRRAARVQIPQYSARHASSCSSHPHSGRERGPAGLQIAGAADERCSLDCCACVQITAPARRRQFRPAVSRPELAAPTQLSGLVEKPRSLQGPAERACRRRADHDSAPRKEPDGPSFVVASLPLTGAANCSFAEPAPARVNEALAVVRWWTPSQDARKGQMMMRVRRLVGVIVRAVKRPRLSQEWPRRVWSLGW